MENTEVKDNEEFRDKLATVTDEGKRIWIYPKKPKGKFYNARNIVSIILLAILVITPFIKVNGRPFMLFNFLERKFIVFGISFGPHDFFLFVIAMIAVVVSIFLFTVVYGRIFCGWVCPQTIFMEMVFRKIEYWIEGNSSQQRRLDRAPWTSEKIIKKTSKHIIFYSLSFFIANIFLSYIIGMDQLLEIISDPPAEHLAGLTSILIFSGVFYFIFAKFREQVCTMVCPYGRLQGVMLDRDSIVIAYDHLRGEPRGKIKKGQENDLGDCVDCNQCVEVCPTGIDIRNGTQLECVNCTACIDACDTIMTKVNRPKGLIRYASKNEIETKVRKLFTPRSIGYTAVLFLLLSLLTGLLITRSDFELSILRTPGIIFQEQPNNKISNLYDLKIINKTFETLPAKLELQNIEGEIKIIGSDLIIEPQGVEEAKFLVILDKDQIKVMNTQIEIAVTTEDNIIDVIKTSFLGKVSKRGSEK
ncbi:MAG: cytochrome c oxidase accessory protein CcoG [Ignavibacteriae bacterium]|nr:cytochrome c oxidase accessory protein CcoG [Ignavibacteriota bacterium]NOG97214.1 cytochrome c oxidase accessory protein CcoG [Ignavibacteriota bacterium]